MARRKSYRDVERQVARIAAGATGYMQPTDYNPNGVLSPDQDMMRGTTPRNRQRISRAYEIANAYRSNIARRNPLVNQPFRSSEQYAEVQKAEREKVPGRVYRGLAQG